VEKNMGEKNNGETRKEIETNITPLKTKTIEEQGGYSSMEYHNRATEMSKILKKEIEEYKKYLDKQFYYFINKAEKEDLETMNVKHLKEELEMLKNIKKDVKKIFNNYINTAKIIDEIIKEKINILLAFFDVKIEKTKEIIKFTKNKKN
jgi:hypothetical protein